MSIISAGGAVVGSAAGGYEIERSLRFNSADSAYLNRTFTTPTNNKKWVYSCWLKRTGFLATLFDFALLTSATNAGALGISGTGAFGVSLNGKFFYANASGVYYYVNVEFRDPSAWYHFVFVADSDNATANDRQILYVNGVRQPNFSATLSLSASLALNSSRAHFIGGYAGGGATPAAGYYANGYLTETNFIDGQDLPSGATTWAEAFGEYNEDTGVWQPKAYTGSYGTNGFYLNFADNSSVAALGYDAAGSNDWSVNGISVTAGSNNDSLVDTPTNYGTDTGVGGEVRGNYATWNPLWSMGSPTFANGNLSTTQGTNATSLSTFTPSSGKWYAEVSGVASFSIVGVATSTTGYFPLASGNPLGYLTGQYGYYFNGNKIIGGSQTAYGASYTTGDVIGIAIDADAGSVTMYKNGVSQGAIVTGLAAGTIYSVGVSSASGSITHILNAGQRPFAYTAPSGFKALCTQNLPEPTIVDGGEYFNTILYTGTGSSNARTGVGFQPDWVWIKERNAAADHGLYDAVRGVQNQLESNTTTAETAEATGLTAFGTDGFTVGALAQLNTSGDTYVAWNWKANGAGVSNTDGTITSTVSANTDSGFSIVTYTGTGANATVGHGLGVAPSMVIVKSRSSGSDGWPVYHASTGATNWLALNLTNAAAASATFWNNTAPTSSVFSIGTNSGVNTNTGTYVAYCFAAIPGYSAFGSYTGNGSADGPFVYTGFRPRFVMAKLSTTAGWWDIIDTARDPHNAMVNELNANGSNAENGVAITTSVDCLSNGFKIRTSDANWNGSGQTIIYAAFAENPFKFSLAR